MFKTDKNKSKRFRATTMLLQIWKSDNYKGNKRKKSNIAIGILGKYIML